MTYHDPEAAQEARGQRSGPASDPMRRFQMYEEVRLLHLYAQAVLDRSDVVSEEDAQIRPSRYSLAPMTVAYVGVGLAALSWFYLDDPGFAAIYAVVSVGTGFVAALGDYNRRRAQREYRHVGPVAWRVLGDLERADKTVAQLEQVDLYETHVMLKHSIARKFGTSERVEGRVHIPEQQPRPADG